MTAPILEAGDRVVAAWAEPASGPGWANHPVLVLVQDANQRLRLDYLQPHEQSDEVATLYAVSATVAGQMRAAVERSLRMPGGGR